MPSALVDLQTSRSPLDNLRDPMVVYIWTSRSPFVCWPSWRGSHPSSRSLTNQLAAVLTIGHKRPALGPCRRLTSPICSAARDRQNRPRLFAWRA